MHGYKRVALTLRVEHADGGCINYTLDLTPEHYSQNTMRQTADLIMSTIDLATERASGHVSGGSK